MTRRALLLIVLLGSSAGVRAAQPKMLTIPKFSVRASTVTREYRERLNVQVPPQAPMVLKSTDLAKSAVGPGWTLIPLPAYTYNRNEGSWIGALAPIFRANAKGQVEDIIAPLYLHNQLIGETFTLNYFGYRRQTQQYQVVLSHATKIEHAVDLSYKNTAAIDGRYIVNVALNADKSAFNRFFGGNNSAETDETQYTLDDTTVKLTGGVNMTHALSLLATERYRDVSIENGASQTLPQLTDKFPQLPGVEAPNVLGHGLTLAYDTRDNRLTPLEGVFATAFAEYDQNIEETERNRWWRLTAEGRWFIPHDDYQAVFVVHGLLDGVVGQDQNDFQNIAGTMRLIKRGVPFYERPTLGGETTLRAFGKGRFVNDTAYLLNLEERISLAQRRIMDNLIEIEVAPFIDIGRVSQSYDSHDIIKRAQVNPGAGLRVLARPNIAARLDAAYGKDGANAYVGLDYPF